VPRDLRTAEQALAGGVEVPEAEWPGEVLGDRVEHAPAGLLLVDRGEDVGAPRGVVELGAGLDRAPFGESRLEIVRARDRVVDAGAAGQQVMDGGSALAREEALDVVDAEVVKGALEIDDAVGDRASVQEREDGFRAEAR
jgi:hypothetical protein